MEKMRQDDEFDTFGKHVANELRLIKDPHRLRSAKLEIQQLLFHAQLESSAPVQVKIF